MDIATACLIFVLAAFIGYYVIWGITPSLHAPLMSVSNAISGIVIIGAITASDTANNTAEYIASLTAVSAAIINICGGFAISQRMLQMFKTKDNKDNHHE